ncbi:armadillo-type protein [Paraphysoderma sedebokerense]|nr:armadillo-type protein [Paraphysoderma sedebokerense]
MAFSVLEHRIQHEENESCQVEITKILGRYFFFDSQVFDQMKTVKNLIKIKDKLSSVHANHQLLATLCDVASSLLEHSKSIQLDVWLAQAKGLIDLSLACLKLSDRHSRSLAIRLLSFSYALKFTLQLPSSAQPSQTMPSALVSDKLNVSDIGVQKILKKYAHDSDGIESISALIRLHRVGITLAVSLYSTAVNSLKDEEEEVRYNGLFLAWVLSTLHPSYRLKPPVSSPAGTAILLANDLFYKTCDMVNDPAVKVRTQACKLLRNYQNVSNEYLLQTLNKKLTIRELRNQNTNAANRHNELRQLATENAGNQLLSGPETDFDTETTQINLVDASGAGAFIHGLEDEYEEVRDEAIESISVLSSQSKEFAEQSVDFVVDAFNDESPSIRLKSLRAIEIINSHFPIYIHLDQLQIFVPVLEDTDQNIREAAHGVLSTIRFTDQRCIRQSFELLKKNMRKFPQDRLTIMGCLKGMGRKNGQFIERIFEDLLGLDKRFVPKEAPVNDLEHILKVILILNATVTNPRIFDFLPRYIIRHYSYLKDMYREFFPSIEPLESGYKAMEYNIDKEEAEGDYKRSNFPEYVRETFDAARKINQYLYERSKGEIVDLLFENKTFARRIRDCINNLIYINHLDQSLAPYSTFQANFFEACHILTEIINSPVPFEFITVAYSFASHLISLSYILENTFEFHNDSQMVSIFLLRVVGNLCYIFKSFGCPSSGQEELRAVLKDCLSRVDLLIADQRIRSFDDLRESLTNLKSAIKLGLSQPGIRSMVNLAQYLKLFHPVFPPVPPTSSKLTWTISRVLAPLANDADTALSFPAKFPINIPIDAILRNIDGVTNVGIMVTLPDQSLVYFWPLSTHFQPRSHAITSCSDFNGVVSPDSYSPFPSPYPSSTQTQAKSYRLRTEINLSVPSAWTSAAPIKIQIVKRFKLDVASVDYNLLAIEYGVAKLKSDEAVVIIESGIEYVHCSARKEKTGVELWIWPRNV